MIRNCYEILFSWDFFCVFCDTSENKFSVTYLKCLKMQTFRKNTSLLKTRHKNLNYLFEKDNHQAASHRVSQKTGIYLLAGN